jgi:uncharacterized membrane protein
MSQSVAAPPPAGVWAPRLVTIATAAFVAGFSWLVLYKHAHLGTRAFDLAIFDQGLWLLSEGETPFVTVRGLHLFGDHSSFIMIPLVPLYWIWPDVRVLLVLTVLAMAAGGALVYAAARAENINPWPAAAMGVGFLLLPAVQWQVWDTFHPEVLAVPLLLAAYLLTLRNHPGGALGLLALVLLVKEDAPLAVIPMAIYLGLRFRRRWLAIGGGVLGVGALILNFKVLLPHWSPTGDLIYSGRYEPFGSSLPEIIWGVLTSPGEVVASLLNAEQPLYLVALILPMAAAVAAPEILALGAPTLLANLLSTHRYQGMVEYHYTAYIIAVAAIAGVVGLRRLTAWAAGRSVRWTRAAIVVALVAALTGCIVGGPWGIGRRNPWAGHAARADLVAEALAVVPKDAMVAGDGRLVVHLAHRPIVHHFPNPVALRNWGTDGSDPPASDQFDWLVMRADLTGLDDLVFRELGKLTESGTFVRYFANDEVIVFRRADTGELMRFSSGPPARVTE